MNSKVQLFNYCELKSLQLTELAQEFVEKNMFEYYSLERCYREEYAINSRFLPRGYYCPSVVLDKIITNTKRGRLLAHLTKRSKPSHRFVYDQENRLIAVEMMSTIPATEYIIYEQDKILGFTFDSTKAIVGLSEELYQNGLLKSYFYVALSSPSRFHSAIFEQYHYKESQLNTVDHIYTVPDRELLKMVGYDALVRHIQLTAEDGYF